MLEYQVIVTQKEVNYWKLKLSNTLMFSSYCINELFTLSNAVMLERIESRVFPGAHPSSQQNIPISVVWLIWLMYAFCQALIASEQQAELA